VVVGLRQPAERPLGQYERLAQVLSVTRDMLEHARQGAWDEVAQLEQTRRSDLQHCFAHPVDAEHGELVAEALAVLLHLNEELMSLLGDAREAVLQQGARQARRRSALGEYHAVQRTPSG
jgi:hypothetical protein